MPKNIMKNWWSSLTIAQTRLITGLLWILAVITGLYNINKYFVETSVRGEVKHEHQIKYLPSEINNEPVKISPTFSNSWQACWYYHSRYKNLFPYMAISDDKQKDSGYPIIRAIAYEAYWQGQECEKNSDGKVQLIGLERTHHKIEIKLSKDDHFRYFANGYGVYRSKLIFDEEGRIIDRHILADPFEYDIVLSDGKFTLKDIDPIPIGKDDNENYFNYVKIFPEKPIVVDQLKKETCKTCCELPTDKNDNCAYARGIEKYIDERKGLHNKLAKKGCGVLTTEPIDKSKSAEPTIMFLCFKNHVRVMERE